MLGYRDSGWGDSPAQEHPAAFVQAPAVQVIGRIVEEIRRFQPHLVLTFEPEGVSGHKDHKAMCRHATAAVQQAGNAEAFPEHLQHGLAPHTPQRLFYAARLQGFRLHRALALRRAGHEVPLPEPTLHTQGVPLADLHVRLDVSPFLPQMLASMRCHQTQMTPDWAFDRVPWDVTVAILGTEYLMQASPTVPPGTPLASTFLEGLDRHSVANHD